MEQQKKHYKENFAVRNATYYITVQQLHGEMNSKTFSISCMFPIDELKMIVESFCRTTLEKVLPEVVSFVRQPNDKRNSHLVAIKKTKYNTMPGQYTLSFTIRYQQYSSTEVAYEIEEYLCHGHHYIKTEEKLPVIVTDKPE